MNFVEQFAGEFGDKSKEHIHLVEHLVGIYDNPTNYDGNCPIYLDDVVDFFTVIKGRKQKKQNLTDALERLFGEHDGLGVNYVVCDSHRNKSDVKGWGGANKRHIYISRLTLDLMMMKLNTPMRKFYAHFKELYFRSNTNVANDHMTMFVKGINTGVKEQSLHDEVKERLAKKIDGIMEYVIDGIGFCDIVTQEYAVEVKPYTEWKHGIGQALVYGIEIEKKPALHLYGVGGRDLTKIYKICTRCGIRLTIE